MIQPYISLLKNTTYYIIYFLCYTWGMCCMDMKGIDGMFQVCRNGQNERYRIYIFHANVLV